MVWAIDDGGYVKSAVQESCSLALSVKKGKKRHYIGAYKGDYFEKDCCRYIFSYCACSARPRIRLVCGALLSGKCECVLGSPLHRRRCMGNSKNIWKPS